MGDANGRVDLTRRRVERRRVHLSVREDDVDTLRWLAAQANKSASIICLIRRAIDRRGFTDVTVANTADAPRVRRTRAQIAEDERDARIKEMASRATAAQAPRPSAPAPVDDVVADTDAGADDPPSLSMRGVRGGAARRSDNVMNSLMDNI